MDLEAANLANARASRVTRAGMVACFVLASAMLITSLAMATTNDTASRMPLTNQTLTAPVLPN